jgi:hypothetical protein
MMFTWVITEEINIQTNIKDLALHTTIKNFITTVSQSMENSICPRKLTKLDNFLDKTL